MDRPQDILSDHEYDGIREYDNPTPGWWWWLFHGTVAFSVVYWVFFQFSPVAWTIHEEYEGRVAQNMRLQFAEIGELEGDQDTLLRFMHDDKWMTVGQAVFKGNCISCHDSDGRGQVGPNLTDDHYKNVKKLTDIVNVVRNGAANGAMPAWKTRLHQNEIVLVSAYVAAMRGENIPGPRGPEGDVIPPWPAYDPRTESPEAEAPEGEAPPVDPAGAAPGGQP